MYQQVNGCALYRQLAPHDELARSHDFRIEITNVIETMDDEKLKSFDLIQFHKNLLEITTFHRIKKLGIKTIADFDDYWVLPSNHLLYGFSKKQNSERIHIGMLRQFDYVSASTERLAKECRKYNDNVYVFPNSINPEKNQYHVAPTLSTPVRIGWIGGACHLPDIQLLKKLPHKLYWDHDVKDIYELQLFGYAPGGIKDHYANILNGDEKYPLTMFRQEDAYTYTQFYNYTDIILVPLVKDKFNSMKSELKIVEAGFFSKPVICSDVHPYKDLLIHGKNALIVKNKNDWFRYAKQLILEPELRLELGKNLHDTVKDKFDLRKTTEYRAEVYRDIING